jgi:hypothetical protein
MGYRPARGLRIVGTLGAVLIIVTGVWQCTLALNREHAWTAAAGLALVALGFRFLTRVSRISIRCDMNDLTVIGGLWSRVIPRSRIEAVSAEPHLGCVTWRTRGGRRIVTPLTSLWGNIYGWMPRETETRARGFLQRVRKWAGVHRH